MMGPVLQRGDVELTLHKKKKKQNIPSSDQWRVVVTVSAHFSNKVRPGAEGEGKREDTWV